MSAVDAASDGPSPAPARRAALQHLQALLQLAPPPAWATPALIGLGLAASLAETLGITLVIAFLYAAMGQADLSSTVGGRLGELLVPVRRWFGSPALLALAILLLILLRAGLGFANRVVSAMVGERISEAARNPNPLFLENRKLTQNRLRRVPGDDPEKILNILSPVTLH